MAELADAHGSGPCEGNFMEVRILLSAPIKTQSFSSEFFFMGQGLLCPVFAFLLKWHE